jgi:PAS domain S-box-containing protein
MSQPHPPAEPARPVGRRSLSIRYSLPLLITVLAFGVVAIYGAAAYREVQKSALDTAATRLATLTQELAGMIGSSITGARSRASDRTSNEAIRSFLLDPSSDPAAALAVFDTAANMFGVELRAADGRRLAATRADLPVGEEADDNLAGLLDRSAGGAVGGLRAVGDSLVAPVAAPVVDADRTIGYVVSWGRITGSGQTQIEQLIGTSARMYVANDDGELWTNLSSPVEALPLDPAGMSGMTDFSGPDGVRWLASAASVAGTPWYVVLEFPRAQVVAPAWRLLRSLAFLGMLAMLLAGAATWLLTGRFTAPIMEVAHTAEALSQGDYTRRSTVSRQDEIGTLSRSFNTMADNVAAAHTSLEQKVAQLALLESQHRDISDRLRNVLASSPDVIYERMQSADGVQFTWVSENVERVLGFGIEDIRSAGWWMAHVHPDDRAAHVAPLPVFGPDRQASSEYRLMHYDGRYRWIRDQQRLVDDAGTIVGAWSDVTALRSLEEQFRQAQKLEAVGQLAGGIAHDFNNIVTVILGESDMALAALPADSPIRESLDQVRTAADRAALLTRQLLTFSSSQLTETTVFSMNDVVLDLQDMLRRLIGADVALEKRISPHRCLVSADRGQVEQVLLNLVINARDAMPDGGTIVIETQDVGLDDEYVSSHPGAGTGEFAALVVSDTGAGMSDDVRAHIFEPFFTTKGPGKGTGLGLATCYGIAQQYGGHVGVYSEVGVGTTMKLYLPSAVEPATAIRPRAPQSALERGTETILLVEDEAQVRAIVARMLAAQGYTVMQAAHGAAALELLESATAPIDLLLTDLIMPHMGGRELAERVRELRPQLKVLFTSGYTEDVIVQNRLLDHHIVLLHKPFTRAALAAKVRETLDAPFTEA